MKDMMIDMDGGEEVHEEVYKEGLPKKEGL
jgi:hypothetical protein